MISYSEPELLEKNHELLQTYSPLVAQLLVHRGITTIADAEKFIKPNYEDNYDPLLMKGVQETVERLKRAIDNDQHITIYGDYDADGIPGAVVLASLFDALKYTRYDIYIPHRHDEGYGIHIDALEKIKENGTQLIVTVDVGITGHDAAHWCKEHTIDLVITDHHLPLVNDGGQEDLPNARIIVNPKQNECSYPDPMLCGSGVIFKVVQGFLIQHRKEYNIPDGWEKWLLDLVGLATVSDMVPLVHENRIFAYYGLQVLKKTRRLGLKKLIWEAGISMKYLNEEDIGFGISPKINAASRMSHPEDALAVLRAYNEVEATARVNHLMQLNAKRKQLVAQTVKKTYSKIKQRKITDVIVVGSPDWQAGILGLVASKLVERYNKPTFVWSEENGEIKGSCRTWNGINLVELMSATDAKTFLQFGGHAEAGGFSCAKKEVHFLEERLNNALQKISHHHNNHSNETRVIDAELTVDDVTDETYHDIEQLAPFGVGNPKPVFIFKSVTPMLVKQFGKTQEHLEIHFQNSQEKTIRAIAFFKTSDDYHVTIETGKPLNLIAHIEHSVFMGKHELRLKIVDCV
ncbi:single-stranded-DNA-specific exonuclease RecJ [Patescibacteria group bacterium]|nr:single-stranded-DNA-specific exonuclease RecJ [Patescibacteria group bacterium]